MPTLAPSPLFTATKTVGLMGANLKIPLAGGRLYSYAAGTTTPKDTYTGDSLLVANTNPVILNSRGEANVWLGLGAYKFLLTDALDVVQPGWPIDDIVSIDQVEANAAAYTDAFKAALLLGTGSTLMSFLQAGAGAEIRSVLAKLRDTVSVRDFGAVLDGVADDTEAWQAALATGKCIDWPDGNSLITEKLVFSASAGQMIYGRSRRLCRFVVNYATFAMGETSVVELSSTGQGLQECGFVFDQPSTAVRANLKQYPWAIDINGKDRAELTRLMIANGWNGIRGEGNSGGAIIEDIETGCFNNNLLIDGARDSVRVNKFHCWPFDFAGDANLLSVFEDGQTVGAEFGLCDDLNIGSLLFLRCLLKFVDTGLGHSFGVANNITLDGKNAGLKFEAGRMSFANLYASTGITTDYKIFHSGGEVRIANLSLENGAGQATYPMVTVDGALTSFMAMNVRAILYGDGTIFKCTSGQMKLAGGTFDIGINTARAAPAIHCVAGRVNLTNLTAIDAGTGTGSFIQIDNVNQHVVAHCQFVGWGYIFPVGAVDGLYGPNLANGNGLVGTTYIQPIRTEKYTGTLDGAGNIVFAHGITSGHVKLKSLQAAYIGASTERVIVKPDYIDGTNISIVAGAGGINRPYECWFEHT